MEGTQFRYVIKFVADMDKAVKFYRDVLGLQVKFESPGWSEFVTGENYSRAAAGFRQESSGKSRIGLHCCRSRGFLPGHECQGVQFSMPPKKQAFGGVLAQFVDSEGAHCSVGAEAA
jgi:predicted enzyme related to lactoylglutathione lyase